MNAIVIIQFRVRALENMVAGNHPLHGFLSILQDLSRIWRISRLPNSYIRYKANTSYLMYAIYLR